MESPESCTRTVLDDTLHLYVRNTPYLPVVSLFSGMSLKPTKGGMSEELTFEALPTTISKIKDALFSPRSPDEVRKGNYACLFSSIPTMQLAAVTHMIPVSTRYIPKVPIYIPILINPYPYPYPIHTHIHIHIHILYPCT